MTCLRIRLATIIKLSLKFAFYTPILFIKHFYIEYFHVYAYILTRVRLDIKPCPRLSSALFRTRHASVYLPFVFLTPTPSCHRKDFQKLQSRRIFMYRKFQTSSSPPKRSKTRAPSLLLHHSGLPRKLDTSHPFGTRQPSSVIILPNGHIVSRTRPVKLNEAALHAVQKITLDLIWPKRKDEL